MRGMREITVGKGMQGMRGSNCGKRDAGNEGK